MMNVNETMADMATMSDAQLKQTAMMNKANPYMIALLSGESTRRQAIRQNAQARTQAQPTVVDQRLAQMDVGQAQAMPEDLGIATLNAPNMETMAAAEGGIVGYAEGGMVAFAPGGTTGNKRDAFLAQYGPIATKAGAELGVDPKLLLAQWGHETDYGTKTVGKFNLGNIKDMTGKGPTAVDRMEKSKASYRTYESPDAFAADYVAQMKRNFPKALGAGADADKFTAGLQEGRLGAYATDPNYEKGVKKTFASLVTAAIPIGSAQAAPEKTGIASVAPADDAASRIPGGYGAPTPPATPKEASFMGRQADKLGLSEDTQRQINNNLNALGGAMGAGFIPKYLPKVPGGLATLGERAYEIINPSKQMTAAQIEAMRVANQGARVAEAAKTAEMAGALPGEALTAAQAVEAANAAKLAQLPSKAELVQDAAALRQAQEANQIATAAKVTQQAGQAAAGSAAIDEALKTTPAPAPAGGIPALVEGSKEDFRRSELEAQYKTESPIQAPAPVADAAAATTGEKPSWLTNDRALMMGLQLLAGSGKPGSGNAIRDLLSGLGTAGLGTLAQEKEERKAKAAEAGELARSKAYEGQGRKYAAEADILESGNKAAVQAATIAKDRMKDFANTMQGKLADQPTRDRLYNQYLLDAYNQLGIIPPAAMASAGTAGTGLKLLGVRPS